MYSFTNYDAEIQFKVHNYGTKPEDNSKAVGTGGRGVTPPEILTGTKSKPFPS